MKRALLILLPVFCTALCAQKVNPHSQINWPAACNAPGMVYNIAANTCTDISHVPPANVAWPVSCSSGVYSPAANGCVPTGSAGNPAAPLGSGQMNAGGVFAPIPGFTNDVNNGWITAGGMRYAKGYQSGAGNNGIFNGQANNQMIIADPSYSFTELPGPNSFTGSPVYYHDLRNAQQTNVYRNPQVAAGANFNFGIYPYNGPIVSTGVSHYCMYDDVHSIRANCQVVGQQSNYPGYSIGAPTGFSAGITGWYTSSNLNLVTQTRHSGIANSLTIVDYKMGIGDHNSQYIYHHNHGGRTAAADESSLPLGINNIEDPDYASTCISGCTPNSGSIQGALGNAGAQGVGRYVIDTTQAQLTGNITAMIAGLSGGQAFTVDASVPVSNAWGTIATINTPNNGIPPFTTTETATVTVTNGTFVAGTLVCFAGSYHEQAIPSSVSGSPPNQTLTFSTAATPASGLRRPHIGGSYVFQGGACGNGLEATYFTTTGGTRYVFDVVGSTDANTLQVGQFVTSGYVPTLIPVTIVQFSNLTNATASSGTTISGVYTASGSTLTSPWSYVGGNSLLLSGSSDSALNGVCTNVQWQDKGHFTCTSTTVGISGIHTTTTPMVATLGINQFKLWPMAETLDVQNYSEALCNPTSLPAGPHAPCVDGTLVLETNRIQFAANDAIEQMNHVSVSLKGISDGLGTRNPFEVLSGLLIGANGYGNAGGNGGLSSNSYISILSTGVANQFISGGGILLPPNVLNVQGPYFIGLNMGGPISEQQALNIQPSATQLSNANYSYSMFNGVNKSPLAATNLVIAPNIGDANLNTGRILTLGGSLLSITGDLGAEIFRPLLTISPLVAPTLTATPSSTGGTLATGTYYYQVQARGAAAPGSGNYYSVRSNEVTCIIPGSVTTGSCTLTWNPVAGAGSYYPSRGATTGTELNASNPIAGLSNTRYVDDNSATFSGGANASANPALAINSAGTAFNVTLQVPAGLGANQTLTITKISTVSITPAAVTASTCAEQTFNTYTGLATTQQVNISPPAFLGAHVWIASSRVSAANTLAIGFCADATGGTPPAGVYLAMAF